MNSQLTNTTSQLLCAYENFTSSVQIIRIVNILDWYFERVIFPGQRLLFEAPSNSELEVHTSQSGQTVLEKQIPCVCLEVTQAPQLKFIPKVF